MIDFQKLTHHPQHHGFYRYRTEGFTGDKAYCCTYTLVIKAAIDLADDPSRGDTAYYNFPGVAVVTWDRTLRAVHVEWKSGTNPDYFTECLETGLRVLTEHRGSRWLADCRNLRPIQPSEQIWLDRSWFPRMLSAGLTRMAVVVAKSTIAKRNVEDILGRVSNTSLDVAYFATIDEAARWLIAW